LPAVLPPEVRAVAGATRPARIERVHRPEIGLTAYVVLDSLALGPAAGGVRIARYADERAALAEACRLARAMTYKCALGGVDAGGGKIVVLDTPELDRERAFEVLGEIVQSLEGDLRTAGELGTTRDDVAAMARRTRYVYADTENLAETVAQGVSRCAEACADFAGRPGLSGLRAAVQGCGAIGAAVAQALAEAGAAVIVADVDAERARELAARVGGTTVSPNEVLYLDVDLLAPCAVGDVISTRNVDSIRAWAVCGSASHICTDRAAHIALHERGTLFVPDLVSSAGAVIEMIGRSVMGLDDRTPLVDALRHTAYLILQDARRTGAPPIDHAIRRAEARLAAAR
jgi:leucine dehydrogenase